LGALRGDVEARHRRAAGTGRQQRGEHVDGGRLAGAVGAEEAVDLPGRHLEVDAVDGVDVAFEGPDEALDDDATMVDGHRPRVPYRLKLSTIYADKYYGGWHGREHTTLGVAGLGGMGAHVRAHPPVQAALHGDRVGVRAVAATGHGPAPARSRRAQA